MYPQSPRGRIHPKISTLPRQRSEAANYLDIYKLVIEKKRLQQELEILEQRKLQIHQRLDIVNRQVDLLKHTAEHMAQDSLSQNPSNSSSLLEIQNGERYKTVVLDY